MGLLALVLALGFGAGPTRSQDPAASDGLDSLAVTRERPLFSTTRRPVLHSPTGAPAPAVAETAQGPTLNLQLQGIVFGEYRRVAIVRRPQDSKATEVSIGSRIDGWVVSDIQPRRIALYRNSTRLVFDLPGPRR